MRYNYAITTLYLNKREYANYNDLALLTTFTKDYWLTQETFEHFFCFLYRSLMTITSLQGKIIKEPYYLEETTGFDQTIPQHYQFDTALLDWSHNHLVAIYFALGSQLVDTKKTERMFCIESDMPIEEPTHLSIFAYQQTLTENFPVKLVDGAHEKTNIRLQRQEGTFTYFTNPLEFYLNNGRFPSIENYFRYPYSNTTFKLVRYNLERTTANLSLLQEYIEGYGINKSFLFPDPAINFAHSVEYS